MATPIADDRLALVTAGSDLGRAALVKPGTLATDLIARFLSNYSHFLRRNRLADDAGARQGYADFLKGWKARHWYFDDGLMKDWAGAARP
jgi:hypothetical protein